jgi:hypothetical protein
MLLSRIVAMGCLGMNEAPVGQLFPGSVGPASVLRKVLTLPEPNNCVLGEEDDWFTANVTAGTSLFPSPKARGTVYLPRSHSHQAFDARVQLDSTLFVLQMKSVVSFVDHSKKTWGPALKTFKGNVDAVQAALPHGIQAIGVWVTMRSASTGAIDFASNLSNNIIVVDEGGVDEFLGAVAHRWTAWKQLLVISETADSCSR